LRGALQIAMYYEIEEELEEPIETAYQRLTIKE